MTSETEIRHAMFGASPFEDYQVPQTEKTTLYWDDEDEAQPNIVANEQALRTDLAPLIGAANFYLYTCCSRVLRRQTCKTLR